MWKWFRQGGRTVCVVALLAALPLGCTSARTARVAQKSPVETASAERADSHDSVRMNLASMSPEHSETTADEVPPSAKLSRSSDRSTQVNEDSRLWHPARVTPVAAGDDESGETASGAVTVLPATSASGNMEAGLTEVTARANSYPLDLAGVLGLADGQNPQVILARERINEAYAQVDRADILWLPSLRAGVNYNRHEGAIQDVGGKVFETNRNSLYGGFGAGAVGAGSPILPGLVANFHLTDAVFQPKIARHQASSRQFAATSARNDVLCDSGIAYLELLRAEQRLAIAREAREKTDRIAKLTGEFARVGQGATADHDRLLAELAARDGELSQAEELVLTASTRLAFLIHADPGVAITTHEPFVVPLDLTLPETTAQELVAQGLSRRPELAEHRQLVGEACERLRREKFAPLIPSILLGASYGGFGGSRGSSVENASSRFDGDAIAYWEVRHLGLGERAIREEAASRLRQAQWREVVVMDRIAQEVVEAHGQVESRRQRIEVAKSGIQAAERSNSLNLQRIENAKGLPIEALQSVQALAQSRRDYLNAVIDHNVAQLRLCRATGWFEPAATRE